MLKICSKFTGEHTCRSALSIKLQSNFIEIALRYGCSLVNLLHNFRPPFPKNTSKGPQPFMEILQNSCSEKCCKTQSEILAVGFIFNNLLLFNNCLYHNCFYFNLGKPFWKSFLQKNSKSLYLVFLKRLPRIRRVWYVNCSQSIWPLIFFKLNEKFTFA